VFGAGAPCGVGPLEVGEVGYEIGSERIGASNRKWGVPELDDAVEDLPNVWIPERVKQ